MRGALSVLTSFPPSGASPAPPLEARLLPVWLIGLGPRGPDSSCVPSPPPPALPWKGPPPSASHPWSSAPLRREQGVWRAGHRAPASVLSSRTSASSVLFHLGAQGAFSLSPHGGEVCTRPPAQLQALPPGVLGPEQGQGRAQALHSEGGAGLHRGERGTFLGGEGRVWKGHVRPLVVAAD